MLPHYGENAKNYKNRHQINDVALKRKIETTKMLQIDEKLFQLKIRL